MQPGARPRRTAGDGRPAGHVRAGARVRLSARGADPRRAAARVPVDRAPAADRRRRARVPRARDLYRGRRSLLWIVPAGRAAGGAGARRLREVEAAPRRCCCRDTRSRPGAATWATFSPSTTSSPCPTTRGQRDVRRRVAARAARAAVRATGRSRGDSVACAWSGCCWRVYFRHRQFGWYFEFKLLAFIGPLLSADRGGRSRRPAALQRAGVGRAVRLHRLAPPWPSSTRPATSSRRRRSQLKRVGHLAAQGRIDPPRHGPPLQLWGAYFLASRPLCSQLPLLDTDYAHVPVSRKADYIVATLTKATPGRRDRPGAPHQCRLPPVPREPGRPRASATARSAGWTGSSPEPGTARARPSASAPAGASSRQLPRGGSVPGAASVPRVSPPGPAAAAPARGRSRPPRSTGIVPSRLIRR